MAKVKDCPGFETFGADVKEARKAKNLARKDLAEKVNIDTRRPEEAQSWCSIESKSVWMVRKRYYSVGDAPGKNAERAGWKSTVGSFYEED